MENKFQIQNRNGTQNLIRGAGYFNPIRYNSNNNNIFVNGGIFTGEPFITRVTKKEYTLVYTQCTGILVHVSTACRLESLLEY